MNLIEVPIGNLSVDPNNPRKQFDKEQMGELADTIKTHGILQPILVIPQNGSGTFRIIAGERRWRAAGLAGLKTVPCLNRDDLNEAEIAEIQNIENLQRADLHPLDEALGYQRIQGDPKNISLRVGKSESYIRMRLVLVNLISEAQKMFRTNKFTLSHAILIARQQPEHQKEILTWLKEDRGDTFGSPHQLAYQIQEQFHRRLKDAPFDIKDAELLPAAGACTGCPKRTGANSMLFPDIKDNDTCTDNVCYGKKCEVLLEKQLAAHPKAVHLTVGGWAGVKAKGAIEWVLADKKCNDTTEGIVVEVVGHAHEKQNAKLGQVIRICDNTKCKVHWQVYRDPSADTAQKKQREAEKKRKTEIRRRGLVFAEIAKTKYDIGEVQQRAVLDWAIDNLSNDTARGLCNAMGWDVVKGKYVEKDFGATVRKMLAKISAAEIPQWTYQIMIADSELWFYSSQTVKADNMEATAKVLKLPMGELAKKASMNKEQLAKLETQVKKGEADGKKAKTKAAVA